jgi:two-component system response regulator ResD
MNKKKKGGSMTNGKIVVIDDDHTICELMQLYLEREGYQVFSYNTGEQALKNLPTINPDLVLLDIMLPGMDGIQVCKEIRKQSTVPVIMLTAKGDTTDKIQGLDNGADDYITKPFDTKEINARIRAVLRRMGNSDKQELKSIEYNNLRLDLSRYELVVKDEIIKTPPKELELLFFLASNPNVVFTRDQLLDEVWGFEYYGDSRTIDVHINRLRLKLQGASDQWELKTVWGKGYKFEVHK